AWKAIIKGWTHPVVTVEDGTTSLKPEAEWSEAEVNEALRNSKALNAIFNGVDKNMFKLINTCTEAKQAWETLQTAHEGTS
ncbi:gag-pol polyprotein, partial [Trifolium medium]|nr:gag-pol polyprotein [Trifolium medium]